jgi:hypothetical protein
VATETDLRLRSWLDSNQRDREQMCRSILALDPHYTDVRPRHPLGGPDGGRDIEAVLDSNTITYGAVGFQNNANDADEQKRKIRAKFQSDLNAALAAKPDLKAFVFLTNLHLTMGEQSGMKDEARIKGVTHCEIVDRERLRIELDAPGGFFIRFQYLAIPLSEAEQASFLARYGDRIQEVVSTGFQRIERTLNRLLFLQEANHVLNGVLVRFQLKAAYPADDIGHFRAFVDITLRSIKHDILTIWFGSSDKSERFRDDIKPKNRTNEAAGIAAGIGGGQWEMQIKLPTSEGTEDDRDDKDERPDRYVQVGSSSSIGVNPVRAIVVRYSHDNGIIRYKPRLQLRDLDDCWFMPVLNRSLADKLHSIQVFANEYKLADIGPEDFRIDPSSFDPSLPAVFTREELIDPWTRIRPAGFSSVFHLRFTSTTPKRMTMYEETRDTAVPKTD